ncbi:MAG TPA: hypothetical protein VF941_12375 [Clostridia bacterium]
MKLTSVECPVCKYKTNIEDIKVVQDDGELKTYQCPDCEFVFGEDETNME